MPPFSTVPGSVGPGFVSRTGRHEFYFISILVLSKMVRHEDTLLLHSPQQMRLRQLRFTLLDHLDLFQQMFFYILLWIKMIFIMKAAHNRSVLKGQPDFYGSAILARCGRQISVHSSLTVDAETYFSEV
jgi:hypothetical protein